MILFKKDMQKQGAKPDYTTKNKTALRMAAAYKKMGVKNYNFVLALIDQDLVGVDPRDPALDQAMMIKISAEAKRNTWYYFRELHRVPSAAGGEATRFRFDRSNIALIWTFFNHCPIILVAIRQSGKSTVLYGLVNNLMAVTTTNTDINLITLDSSMRERAIIAIKETYNLLPTYLRLRSRKTGDHDNAESFTVLSLGNRLRTFIGQKSIVQARKSGRGQTSPITLVDEGPYIDNINVSLEIAATSGVAAREIAEANGAPYNTVIMTTAGYKDTNEGEYVYKMMEKSSVFSERFFDAEDAEAFEKSVRANSRGNVFRIQATFTHRMLGKTDEWLDKAMEASMVEDPLSPMALADFRGIWMSGSKTAFLSPGYLKKLNDLIINTSFEELYEKEGYIFKWYIEEEDIEYRMNHAIMSLDTSEGTGSDDIVLTAMCVVTGEVIGTGTFNTTNIIDFSEYLFGWFVKYEKFVCVIEAKSTGRSVIDYLLRQMKVFKMNPFKRLFSTLVDNSEEHAKSKELFSSLKSANLEQVYRLMDDNRKTFGFPTSGAGKYSRDELYGSLKQAIKIVGSGLHDTTLIKQMSGLVTKKGRIDHGSGEHDDAVVSFLLSIWLLMKGSNLDYYGINASDVLSEPMLLDENDRDKEDDRSAIEVYADEVTEHRQTQIRKKMLSLMDQLRGDGSIEDVKLEFNIKGLESLLKYKESDGTTYSLTAFKEKLKKKNEASDNKRTVSSRDQYVQNKNPLMSMF